ncbi:hypothetical protein [Streptomyces sp. BA2]|uniref:hypothetical protein n=1 Tax=Streptomyces sp. BA2 TaxID=436595 RepID=UPI0013242DAE|nr:hypothetical protein [Streptomyces sp. BA2]MWA08832.1 hypothetical protein [Streptomyces sp. BA2]
MTLTDLIPGLRDKPKGEPKHRVDDYLKALKAEHAQQLAGLRHQMDGLREENVALLNAKAAADDGSIILEQLITDLEADVKRLNEQAGIDRKHLAQQAGMVRTLREDLDEATGRRADKKNVETAATKTQETDVSAVRRAARPVALQDAAAAGLLSPVVQVSTSGASADPGHVRAASWGVDATVPLKTVKGVA